MSQSIITLSEDLGNMEEFEALPPGPYPAEVRDVEIKHSEKVPQGYFVISMLIDPEDFPADYDVANAPEGLPITYARVAVPVAENRRSVAPIKRWLKALGLPAAGMQIDTDQWIGKKVQVMLSSTTYQGAPVNNVEGVSELPTA